MSPMIAGCSDRSRSYDTDDYDSDDSEDTELLAGGLFGKSDSTESDSDNQCVVEEKVAYNDVACFGLYGPVKTVEQDGRLLAAFDRNGMLQKLDYYSRYLNYKRESSDLYTCDIRGADNFIPIRITIKNGERDDIDTQGNGDFACYKWMFDDAGRLISKRSSIEFYVTTVTYEYHGDDRLPYKITSSEGEGGGSGDSSETYNYISTDSYGNWTKAKVEGSSVWSDDLEDHSATKSKNYSSVVNRRITYYD